MEFLEEVQITIAVKDSDWGRCGTLAAFEKGKSSYMAKEILARFVPPNGYPHNLREGGIVQIASDF